VTIERPARWLAGFADIGLAQLDNRVLLEDLYAKLALHAAAGPG
jgi:hypothetical protein